MYLLEIKCSECGRKEEDEEIFSGDHLIEVMDSMSEGGWLNMSYEDKKVCPGCNNIINEEQQKVYEEAYQRGVDRMRSNSFWLSCAFYWVMGLLVGLGLGQCF